MKRDGQNFYKFIPKRGRSWILLTSPSIPVAELYWLFRRKSLFAPSCSYFGPK